MYARVISFRCDPARLDEVSARLDEIRISAKTVAGLTTVYSVWRADGNGVTMALYESQADAEAAESQIQSVWSKVADLLVEQPKVETYDHAAHVK